MNQEMDLKAMNAKIKTIRSEALALQQMADAFPAVARNSARVLSSAKMLEINLSDIVNLANEPH